MRSFSIVFVLLCMVGLGNELRMESIRPLGRSLEESSISFTACGTWNSGCRSSGSNSFQTTIRFDGKDKEVPTGIVLSSKSYSGSECSGDAVLDEEIAYTFESVDVKDTYPYILTVTRKVSSFSVMFKEWKYFGKNVTCTGMELGKTYSLADAQCVDSDNKDVFEILRSSESDYKYYFQDGNVLRDNDSSGYDYVSSKGCSQPMTWLVWVVVIVVVVIVIVVIVVLATSNKKKEMKKEEKPAKVDVEMKPVQEKPAEEKKEEKPAEEKKEEEKPAEEEKKEEEKPAEEEKKEEEKKEEKPDEEEKKEEEKPTEEEKKEEEKPVEEEKKEEEKPVEKEEEKPAEEVKEEKPAEEEKEEKPAEEEKKEEEKPAEEVKEEKPADEEKKEEEKEEKP